MPIETNHSHIAGHRFRRRALAALAVLGLGLTGVACTSSSTSTDSLATAGSSSSAGDAVQTYKNLDAGGPLTVGALEKGSVDVAELFSVNGAIAANGWVVLEDDKHLQAADNFVPAIRTDKVKPEVSAILNEVSAAMTQEGVQELVKEVSVDGENPDDVAEKWLDDHDLPGDLKASGSITVGTADFAESEIVGQTYAKALESAGMDVNVRSNIGERAAYIPLLERGDIDLIPEFTASLLVFLDKAATPSGDLDTTYAAAKKAAESNGFTLLEASQVNDVNVFVVTKKTADKYKLKTLSDLAASGASLRWGVAPACKDNAQCIPGLEKTYGFKFKAG